VNVKTDTRNTIRRDPSPTHEARRQPNPAQPSLP
jgi:hypothetical protein